MRHFIVGIPLILLYATLVSVCGGGTQNADQSKIHEIDRMWQAMPNYPGLVEVGTSRSSTDDKAHVSKNFKLAGHYEDVRRFYIEGLTQQGWQLTKERKMNDWGRDFGGQQLNFTKGDYKLSIEYAGERATREWDYGIGVYWRGL